MNRAAVWLTARLFMRGLIIWAIAFALIPQPVTYYAVIASTMGLHFAWRVSRYYPTPYPRRTKGAAK